MPDPSINGASSTPPQPIIENAPKQEQQEPPKAASKLGGRKITLQLYPHEETMAVKARVLDASDKSASAQKLRFSNKYVLISSEEGQETYAKIKSLAKAFGSNIFALREGLGSVQITEEQPSAGLDQLKTMASKHLLSSRLTKAVARAGEQTLAGGVKLPGGKILSESDIQTLTNKLLAKVPTNLTGTIDFEAMSKGDELQVYVTVAKVARGSFKEVFTATALTEGAPDRVIKQSRQEFPEKTHVTTSEQLAQQRDVARADLVQEKAVFDEVFEGTDGHVPGLEPPPSKVTNVGTGETAVTRMLSEKFDGDLRPGGPQMEAFANLPVDSKVELLADLAKGITHLHNRGFAHCDLQPKNLLAKLGGNPDNPIVKKLVVTDMGGSQKLEEAAEKGRNRITGTPPYTSYYDFSGEGAGPPESWDVFSFSILALELLMPTDTPIFDNPDIDIVVYDDNSQVAPENVPKDEEGDIDYDTLSDMIKPAEEAEERSPTYTTHHLNPGLQDILKDPEGYFQLPGPVVDMIYAGAAMKYGDRVVPGTDRPVTMQDFVNVFTQTVEELRS